MDSLPNDATGWVALGGWLLLRAAKVGLDLVADYRKRKQGERAPVRSEGDPMVLLLQKIEALENELRHATAQSEADRRAYKLKEEYWKGLLRKHNIEVEPV